MHLLKQRFYLLYLAFLALAGFWLLLYRFNLWPNTFSICFFKSVTGIACPGCGTTRAVNFFLVGDFLNAIKINPLGLGVSLLLAISVLIFFVDLFSGREHLKILVLKSELVLKQNRFLLPVLTIISANWFWSIMKGL